MAGRNRTDLLASLLDIHRNSVINYRKEARPIISLLDRYFSDDEVEEFLETGRVLRFESPAGMSDFFFRLLLLDEGEKGIGPKKLLLNVFRELPDSVADKDGLLAYIESRGLKIWRDVVGSALLPHNLTDLLEFLKRCHPAEVAMALDDRQQFIKALRVLLGLSRAASKNIGVGD